MKIQFILNYSDLYGANRSILSIIEHLHEKQHIINVMIPSKGDMYKELMSKDISCEIVPYYAAFLYIKPMFKHSLIPILALMNVFIFPLMVLKIKRFSPDIIYSNTSAENLGVFISKILGIKHILHVREFMQEDYSARFVLGRRMKSKFINWSNASIYVSNTVLNTVHFNNKNNKYHRVIYNGIQTDKTKLEDKNVNFKQLKFGIVGIFDPAKGQYKAIEYFKEILEILPNAKLFIYGDKEGSYKEKIMKLVDDLDLTHRVNFKGFEVNIDVIYGNIDVLLMFSRSEGFGRVTIEAAFQGVPVIGYNNAGTSELVIDKETGYLFEDIDSFKKVVFELVESKFNYDTIRRNAFNNAFDLYTLDKYCFNVEQYIIKIHNR